MVYAQEHVPHTKRARTTSYYIGCLAGFWGGKTVSHITARSCREYASNYSSAAARRHLEVLRAAVGYYNGERGPLVSIPTFALPSPAQPRSRWLNRTEAARLLKEARALPHLRRFVLMGLYTGSRPGTIISLTWDQIDIARGVLHRRAAGEAEDARKRRPPVRLGKRILSHLRRWRRLDPPEVRYLCHYDGRMILSLQHSFVQAVRRAGLVKVTPHTLRHTRATWLMQAGVPIWEAAGHLGMTVEMLSKVYGHHHPDWQKRAAEV